MAWCSQYWEMFSNFYWNPSYLGMKSRSVRKSGQLGDDVLVPRSWLDADGRIYTRSLKQQELEASLARKEEILNQFFNLTFAIAPDALIAKLFGQALEFDDAGPFEFLGQRDVVSGFGLAGKEIGQHDALVLSANSAMAIELKTGAATSAAQVMKYVALLARIWRERPQIQRVGLLMICPEGHSGTLLDGCGVVGSSLPSDFIARNLGTMNADVRGEFAACAAEAANVAMKMKIAVLTWSELHRRVVDVRSRLQNKDSYQQTLRRCWWRAVLWPLA